MRVRTYVVDKLSNQYAYLRNAPFSCKHRAFQRAKAYFFLSWNVRE